MLGFTPNRISYTEVIPWTVQELLFIREVKYLDYDILTLPNLEDIFIPTKRTGYNFYLKTKNGEYQVLKVKIKTIYKHNKKVVRCFMEFADNYTKEEIESETYNASYLPLETVKDKTIGIYYEKESNGLYQYNFHYNGHYLGFVSEFGEYEKYDPKAEGNMFFCFDDCPLLIKSNVSIPLDEYTEEHNYYRKLLKDNFPYYKGGLSNFKDSIIVAVAEDNVNNLLVKQWHLFEGYKYYYIKFNSHNILREANDPFTIFALDSNDIYNTSDGFIGCRSTNIKKRFNPNNKIVGKSVRISRGFSIDDRRYEGEFPGSFFSCLIIDGETKYFYEYNPAN